MKENYKLILAITLLIVIAFIFNNDSCNKQNQIDNTNFAKLDSLVAANDSIKALSDSLQVNYSEAKIVKDSLVIKYTSRYVTYYDTTTRQVYNCLPMVHVDSLVMTYESLILDADTIIKVQSIQINNLEQQNAVKDTVILQQQSEIKRQKKGKLKAFIGGVGVGALVRSLF
jgi:hypothetical protein